MLRNKQTIQSDGNFISVEVEVVILKEGDYFVSYCPALELSSYAKSEAKAKEAFIENLDILFEETIKKGTLEKVLLGLGWELKQKPQAVYSPPKRRTVQVDNFVSSLKERVSIPLPC